MTGDPLTSWPVCCFFGWSVRFDGGCKQITHPAFVLQGSGKGRQDTPFPPEHQRLRLWLALPRCEIRPTPPHFCKHRNHTVLLPFGLETRTTPSHHLLGSESQKVSPGVWRRSPVPQLSHLLSSIVISLPHQTLYLIYLSLSLSLFFLQSIDSRQCVKCDESILFTPVIAHTLSNTYCVCRVRTIFSISVTTVCW